jgi:peptidoglycan hydrolase-like protein with peptidoglycan-binding domain
MAQQTTVRFVDDLDGSEAVGTVTFSLENRAYEIDLSDENTDKLHEALAPFIEHARQIGRGSGRGRGRRQPATEKHTPVRGFQQALATDIPSVAVDGIVGPVTWQALVSGMLSF